jgi:hypothetical protein
MGKKRKNDAGFLFSADIPPGTFITMEIDLQDHMSELEIELSEEDIIERIPLCEPEAVLAELDHDDIFTYLMEHGEPEALRLAIIGKFGPQDELPETPKPEKPLLEQVRFCDKDVAVNIIKMLVKSYAVEMSEAVHNHMRTLSIR